MGYQMKMLLWSQQQTPRHAAGSQQLSVRGQELSGSSSSIVASASCGESGGGKLPPLPLLLSLLSVAIARWVRKSSVGCAVSVWMYCKIHHV